MFLIDRRPEIPRMPPLMTNRFVLRQAKNVEPHLAVPYAFAVADHEGGTDRTIATYRQELRRIIRQDAESGAGQIVASQQLKSLLDVYDAQCLELDELRNQRDDADSDAKAAFLQQRVTEASLVLNSMMAELLPLIGNVQELDASCSRNASQVSVMQTTLEIAKNGVKKRF